MGGTAPPIPPPPQLSKTSAQGSVYQLSTAGVGDGGWGQGGSPHHHPPPPLDPPTHPPTSPLLLTDWASGQSTIFSGALGAK